MNAIARVGAREALRLMEAEEYAYVDVRSEPEYAGGHPKGAINVPLSRMGARGLEPNGDFLRVMKALFSPSAKLVLGCAAGVRSWHAALALEAEGFDHLVDQRAGFGGVRNAFGQISEAGWAAAGLPVETETAGGSYEEVLERLGPHFGRAAS